MKNCHISTTVRSTSTKFDKMIQLLTPSTTKIANFWATVSKTVCPMLSDHCLCLYVLSVTFVCCGQMVGCIKMKLGTDIGLGRSHTVLDGDPDPSQKWANSSPTLGPMYCGQTAGWIKTPLGMEVGLGPGHIVLDGDPVLPSKKGHSPHSSLPIFGPCLLWPNGWMDHNATWYGGRPHPSHIVLDVT